MKAGLMLGVNPNAKREENDFYATDPWAIYHSKNFFEEIGLDKTLWEPACGLGHLVYALENIGYRVRATDLVERLESQLEGSVDFLQCNDKWKHDILTNPPFKIAHEFVKKSMELLDDGHKAVFFLKIQFLETTKRQKLFEENGLKYVGVFSERICCAKNGEFDLYFKKSNEGKYKGGTQLYAWFVFEKGYKGEPVIKFI